MRISFFSVEKPQSSVYLFLLLLEVCIVREAKIFFLKCCQSKLDQQRCLL